MQTKESVYQKFVSTFGQQPSIFVAANGRANIIGEHTDYHYGFVFPFAIDKGIFMCASKSDITKIISCDYGDDFEKTDIQKGSWQSYLSNAIGFIEARFDINIKLQLAFGGDLPIGSGVSSSSALCCGFIELINQLYDLNIPQIDKVNLASQIEHGTGVIGGKMDQYTILFGQENKAMILDCRDLSHTEASVPEDWKFLLINSGVKHNLATTAYNDRRKDGEEALAIMQKTVHHLTSLRDLDNTILEQHKSVLTSQQYNRAFHVIHENERVWNFKKEMDLGNYEACGSLLNASHESLRDLYDVSCEELDLLQSLAVKSNFIAGSRMMGGGFGGCTINLIKNIDVNEMEYLQQEFENKFGYRPEFFEVKPAKGLSFHG